MKDLEKLLRLENYKIMKIKERSENKKMIKVICIIVNDVRQNL